MLTEKDIMKRARESSEAIYTAECLLSLRHQNHPLDLDNSAKLSKDTATESMSTAVARSQK